MKEKQDCSSAKHGKHSSLFCGAKQKTSFLMHQLPFHYNYKHMHPSAFGTIATTTNLFLVISYNSFFGVPFLFLFSQLQASVTNQLALLSKHQERHNAKRLTGYTIIKREEANAKTLTKPMKKLKHPTSSSAFETSSGYIIYNPPNISKYKYHCFVTCSPELSISLIYIFSSSIFHHRNYWIQEIKLSPPCFLYIHRPNSSPCGVHCDK